MLLASVAQPLIDLVVAYFSAVHSVFRGAFVVAAAAASLVSSAVGGDAAPPF